MLPSPSPPLAPTFGAKDSTILCTKRWLWKRSPIGTPLIFAPQILSPILRGSPAPRTVCCSSAYSGGGEGGGGRRETLFRGGGGGSSNICSAGVVALSRHCAQVGQYEGSTWAHGKRIPMHTQKREEGNGQTRRRRRRECLFLQGNERRKRPFSHSIPFHSRST